MDESNVDLCDDISNADTIEIEKNNGDTESDIETFIPDRNGANEFQVQNDFNRPISAIAVDANRSAEDMVLIQRGVANDLELSRQNDDQIANVDHEFQKVCLTSSDTSKSDSNEANYIDQKTLDLEKRLEDLLREDQILLPEVPTKSIDSTYDIVNPGVNSVGRNRNREDQTTDYDELMLPEVPSDPHNSNEDIAESRSDGRSCSCSIISVRSSNSLSRSYIYSSASVDGIEDIPEALTNYTDKQILVPKYKPNGSGYCWPIDKLPLSGKVRFDEGHQWITATIEKPLGSGASGECSIGHTITQDHNDNGTIFCVKKLHKYNKEEVLSMYLAGKDHHEQKQAATSLNGSENIVQFYGATYWKKDVCIFMELMEGGTVEELLQLQEFKDSGLPKYNYFSYLKDVLSGLAFLHGKGRAHNDVKSGNVLLDYSRLQAKLADFGNASAICDNDNSKRKDILSAGCFLLEMLGSFIDYNAMLKLKLGCTFGCACDQQLPKHSDNDTNTILQMFFGTKSIYNTAISIAKQCEAILHDVDIVNK